VVIYLIRFLFTSVVSAETAPPKCALSGPHLQTEIP
jgi:hypothetical protein